MKSKKLFPVLLIFFSLLLISFIPFGMSADTGYTSGSSASNVDRGYQDFSNPSNALSDNEVYATCDIGSKEESDYLYIYNFGFDIDDSATITGIIVQIEDYGESTNILESELYLYFDSSTQGDDKMGSSQIGELPDADTYSNYGSDSDTWNSGITVADLETTAFGVYIAYYNDHNTQPREVYVDHVQIIVYYSLPSESNEPQWDNLLESSDPLELGNNESISIDVTDESTISNVYLEFDNVNHSMNLISGDTYNYDDWQPATTGLHEYTIWMIDEFNNINSTSGDITVVDTTNPTIENIVESADPLILGNIETIECDVTDLSDIEWVYLEFDSVNHSMSIKSGDTYEYTTWQPASAGIKYYTIWANDSAGNIAHVDGQITVNDVGGDVYSPTILNLVIRDNPSEIELFVSFTVHVNDSSNVSWVYLEFNGINYSMNDLGDDIYYLAIQINVTGEFIIKIHASDSLGNIGYIEEILLVQNTYFIVFAIIIMIFMMGLSILIYTKIKIWLLMLVIFAISLLVGINALQYSEIVFFPNFAVLFLMFQSAMFISASLKQFKKM